MRWYEHVLNDSRIEAAAKAASAQTGKSFLDVLAVILENLPAILADLNNPAALLALIIQLLNPPTPAPAA